MKQRIRTTDRDLGLNRIMEDVAWLASHNISVGVQGEMTYENTGEASLADIAYWNEYGTEDGRIPERPAFRTAYENNQDELNSQIENLFDSVLTGQANPRQGLERIGKWYVNRVRNEIIGWQTPRNADSTIRKKGFNNPLVDTYRLVKAVTLRIVETKPVKPKPSKNLTAQRKKAQALGKMGAELKRMQALQSKMRAKRALSDISSELRAMRSILK